MRIKISKNKSIFSVSFYKIDYEKTLKLLKYLKVDGVSVFVDNIKEYTFTKNILVEDFIEYMSALDEITLIFDGKVSHCIMDKEMEVLSNKKILIDFNLGENLTSILINLDNTKDVKITKEIIKKIMK